MQQNTTTLTEELKAVLEGMRDSITAKDRALAVKKFGCTVQTISRYLNGKGPSLDTATDFIEFFGERIAQRNKITHDAVIQMSKASTLG